MFASVDNWRFAKKTLAAYSFLGLLIIGLALNSVLSDRTLTRIATDHVERGIAGLSTLADLTSDIKELRIIVYSYATATAAAEEAELTDRFQRARARLHEDIVTYRGRAGSDLQSEVDALQAKADALVKADMRVLALRRGGDREGALALLKEDAKERSQAAVAQVEKLLQRTRIRSEFANAAGVTASRVALVLAVLLSIATLGALAVIWVMVELTVAKPMEELSVATATLAQGGEATVPYRKRGDEMGRIANAVELFRVAALERATIDAEHAAEQKLVTSALGNSLEAMRRGDLTTEIDADFPPAYAELQSNFNAALASLRALIGTITSCSAAVRNGSMEIARASEDLARRTEGNAASLEETTSALAQMESRLKATAEAATHTVERADGAIATVSGGREVADEAVAAMNRVSESARGIDSVIEGLDKIAFQTRVLAMNAAVEAGRAGEAGRGFAVVADLVSALAMRAEEEAKRARSQLTVTQTDIGAAVDAVTRVDGALADIFQGVEGVHALLGTMAEANQAQSTTITQISTALGMMDRATQQNAAMVEQTSAAARTLTGEVGVLAEQAAHFTIDARAGAIIARSPSASASPRNGTRATPGRASL